jgi:hypothetical protein
VDPGPPGDRREPRSERGRHIACFAAAAGLVRSTPLGGLAESLIDLVLNHHPVGLVHGGRSFHLG